MIFDHVILLIKGASIYQQMLYCYIFILLLVQYYQEFEIIMIVTHF